MSLRAVLFMIHSKPKDFRARSQNATEAKQTILHTSAAKLFEHFGYKTE